MKKNTSKIASMLLAVSVLFSMFSIPTTFAATNHFSENFDGYTLPLDTVWTADNTADDGITYFTNNDLNSTDISVVADPTDSTNKVVKLAIKKKRSAIKIVNGLYSGNVISGISTNDEVSIKFSLARENENSKIIAFTPREGNNTDNYFAFYFDMSTGQVTTSTITTGTMSPVPAGSTLYFADYVNKPVPVNTWVDIEIRIIGSSPRRMMVYANEKPLVYGADAPDDTVSVKANRSMLPMVAATGSTWTNNGVNQIYFVANSAEAYVSTDATAEKPSFYVDDISVDVLSGDEKACSLNMIDSVSTVMDDYSATLASPTIINTDMELPVDDAYSADVTWESETEGVTVQNNKVILPNADDVTEAVLKATVTRGDASFSQKWTVKLAPRIKASVTATPADGKLTSVTVNNRFALPESAKIVLGVYNDTTKLFNIFKMIDAPTTVDVHTVDVNEITVNDGETVKAYVWDMNTLEPLAKIN